MFLSLAQATENEEGNNSSVGLQVLHPTCRRPLHLTEGAPSLISALSALLPRGTYGKHTLG